MNETFENQPTMKVNLAYDRWCAVMGRNDYHGFWKFLRTDHVEAMSTWVGSFKVHKDGLKRLEMLQSDNWRTYISAHKARTKK